MIGRIEKVPLRSIWRHEAYDFTTWLQENIDVLNVTLGIELNTPEREQSAGSFSVDLVAEDDSGNFAIIENQLEKSDHDHLGKLITYLTAFEAKTAIWIVADPRPEHINAVRWLNESYAATFYLLKLEGIKINDSAPAPLLTLIVGPSEVSRETSEKKKELAARHIERNKFWSGLLEQAKQKTKLHASISPTNYGWIGTGAGKSGLAYNYTIKQREAAVELYIDRGKDSDSVNKSIFDTLLESKDVIEKDFGGELDWQRLDDKRACRVTRKINIGGYRDEERWSDIYDEMIHSMIKLEAAFSSHIKKLPI